MLITEEKAKIQASTGKISKKLDVFYNPVMKLNRDVTVLLLNALNREMQMALPLAGSGIRGIRILQEIKVKCLDMNDYKTAKQIKDNLKLNNLEANVFSKDANQFLLESKGYDYIDIDPFGSPNPFLDSAIVRIARQGILAVTATDTSALAGSSKNACLRKYWAVPMKNEMMHEMGIRILLRKIQLIGAQHDKALIPVFSYSKDHYYRVFLRCEKGKTKVDEILKQHKYFLYNPKNLEREVSDFNIKEGYNFAGPLWIGQLWDKPLVKNMFALCDKDNQKLFSLMELINEECVHDDVGFYDLNKLSKIKKVKMPKTIEVLSKDCSRTHFLGWGIRGKIPF